MINFIKKVWRSIRAIWSSPQQQPDLFDELDNIIVQWWEYIRQQETEARGTLSSAYDALGISQDEELDESLRNKAATQADTLFRNAYRMRDSINLNKQEAYEFNNQLTNLKSEYDFNSNVLPLEQLKANLAQEKLVQQLNERNVNIQASIEAAKMTQEDFNA